MVGDELGWIRPCGCWVVACLYALSRQGRSCSLARAPTITSIAETWSLPPTQPGRCSLSLEHVDRTPPNRGRLPSAGGDCIHKLFSLPIVLDRLRPVWTDSPRDAQPLEGIMLDIPSEVSSCISGVQLQLIGGTWRISHLSSAFGPTLLPQPRQQFCTDKDRQNVLPKTSISSICTPSPGSITAAEDWKQRHDPDTVETCSARRMQPSTRVRSPKISHMMRF